jgi:hypothetical protein
MDQSPPILGYIRMVPMRTTYVRITDLLSLCTYRIEQINRNGDDFVSLDMVFDNITEWDQFQEFKVYI